MRRSESGAAARIVLLSFSVDATTVKTPVQTVVGHLGGSPIHRIKATLNLIRHLGCKALLGLACLAIQITDHSTHRHIEAKIEYNGPL